MYIQYGYNNREDSDRDLRVNLAKAAGFSAADLAENKKGRMSTAQMGKVLFGSVAPLFSLLFPLFGIGIVAALVYFFAPYLIAKISIFIRAAPYFMTALGAIACGLLAILMKSIFASGRLLGAVVDLAGGLAVKETARVRTKRTDDVEDGLNQLTKKKTQTYALVVGDKDLLVSQTAYEEINENAYGGWFNVYYTKRSHFLLSIEPAAQSEIDGSLDQQRAA